MDKIVSKIINSFVFAPLAKVKGAQSYRLGSKGNAKKKKRERQEHQNKHQNQSNHIFQQVNITTVQIGFRSGMKGQS